jgi:hypothetical protein
MNKEILEQKNKKIHSYYTCPIAGESGFLDIHVNALKPNAKKQPLISVLPGLALGKGLGMIGTVLEVAVPAALARAARRKLFSTPLVQFSKFFSISLNVETKLYIYKPLKLHRQL